MEKYYTPTIEEFHVGIENVEFKQYKDFASGSNEMSWQQDTTDIHVMHRLDIIKSLLDKKAIRIKHLDREDIESLGWEFKSNVKGTIGTFNKDNYLMTVLDNGYVVVSTLSDKFNMMGEQDTRNIFVGVIKNKSELKRVLTQIGVI